MNKDEILILHNNRKINKKELYVRCYIFIKSFFNNSEDKIL